MNEISSEELKNKLKNEEVFILDVRTPLEFSTFNIGGINMPLQSLNSESDILEDLFDDEIIVVCQHGIRSITAQAILIENGFTQVKNLTGGLVAFNRSE